MSVKSTQVEQTGTQDGSGVPQRASWSNPIEFILSCMGYAIGLGNVWRFPYLCYKNGGGAFLVTYLLMVFVMGMPIFLLELVIGQYSGLGPNEAFTHLAPIFSGLGYCTLVVITLVTVYYMVIIAWTIFYLFASFSSELKWGSCTNDFNSYKCYSALQDESCVAENRNSTYWNRTCNSVENLCIKNNLTYAGAFMCANGTTNININDVIPRVLSSEEYFNEYVLGINGATWENFGGLRWQLVLCLLLAWIITYSCVVKGVQSFGKAVYFTSLFPYVVLTALLVRGVTLEGAKDGILVYMQPDWDLLLDASVWGNAASQTFYSFGIGCGSLITLASYSSFKNNCHRDVWIVTVANVFTSIYAGFSIFAILGFLANKMDASVKTVAQDGPGLAFVAYPEAVLRMPLSQLWSIAFFLMLLTLGFGSQFAGIEAVNTAILDKWPGLRKKQAWVTLGTCTVCFLLGLPMCCNGGVYIFTLLEWNTASWAILLIGLAEVGIISWAYGCNRFLGDIKSMSIKLSCVVSRFWWICWIFVTPLALVGVFLFTMINFTSPTFGKYVFPDWANVLGWLIGLATLVPLPIFAVYQIWKAKYTGMQLIQPTSKWGPADKVDQCNSMESLTRTSLNTAPSTVSVHL